MKEITAAIANFRPAPMDVERNLRAMESVVAESAGNGASLVCFPEVSSTGYVLPDVLGCAEPIDGPTVRRIAGISRKHGVCVSAGFVELSGGKRYITHVLAEDGELAGAYRKTHLGHRERTFFSAGESIPVFNTSLGKIGICLCWEYRFPEIFRVLALKGADLVLAPFASGMVGEKRRKVWNRYFPARAGDDCVYVAACNAIADADGPTGGGIMALGPRGEVLAEDYSLEEKTVYVTFSPEKLEKSRTGGTMGDNYFIMERKPPLYREIVSTPGPGRTA